MNSNYAIFPFGQVEHGSKVVIYGAGRAGQNFFHQVRNMQYCDIIYIVDQNYERIKFYGVEIRPIEALKNSSEYDYCVISVLDFNAKQQIFDTIKSLGIPEEKIILPVNNEFSWAFYGFSSQSQEYEYAKSFEGYFRQCDAREFVRSKRMDITVRYLLFKDFINRIDRPEHKSLYSRCVLARSGGKEAALFHSGDGKDGVRNYIEKAKELCESISENGFLPEHYIPVSECGATLDGLHRIAAAIVTGNPVMVREYHNSQPLYCDFSIFERTGFGTEDKIRVLRALADICPDDCAVAVLFAPVFEMWKFIESKFEEQFTIVGRIDLDFSGNYVAFENILHELYNDGAFCNQLIYRKINVLKMSPLQMRLLLLSGEGFKDAEIPFFERMKTLKTRIRESMFFDTMEVPVVLHTPDNINESILIKNILLSVNNLRHARRRFTQRYTKKFIDMLNEFKSWCYTRGIPVADTCIVGGAVMNVFGIKEADDIDFILMPEHRAKLTGDDSCKISDTLDIAGKNRNIFFDGNVISDKTIITDDNMHFWFYGCKFLDLDLLHKRKQLSERQKDKESLRMLDMFMELETAYNGKTALRRQIEDEMFRRGLCL
jgi:hypothetical protein